MPPNEEARSHEENGHPGQPASAHDTAPSPEFLAGYAAGWVAGYDHGYLDGYRRGDLELAADLSAWLKGHRPAAQARMLRLRADRGEARPPDALDENRRHDTRVLRAAGVDLGEPGREAAA